MSVSASEQLALDNEQALSDEFGQKAADQNVAEYLREEKMSGEEYKELPEAWKRIIADAKLLVSIGELPVDDPPLSDRDALVAFFERENWQPKTKEEAAAALPKGLNVSGLKKPRKKRSQAGKEAEYVRARGLNQDAITDLMTFGEIGVHEKRRGKPLNTSWLKKSRKGQYMIADALLAREFLGKGAWLEQDSLEHLQRQSYWRGFMLLAAEHASQDALSDTLKFFFDKAQQRQARTARQYAAAGSRVGKPILRGIDIPVPEKHDTRPQSIKDIMPPGIKIKIEMGDDDAADARIANQLEQGISLRAAEAKEAGGGRVLTNEASKKIGTMPPDRKPSAHAWAVHNERVQGSNRVREAVWKRKADTGPSSKAKGEI